MKVLSICPNPSDGTSWYRAALPMARLQQSHDNFQFVEYGRSDLDWSDMVNFDILFIQRPYGVKFLELANKAITLGLKVWVDFDDMIWDVPEHSVARASYGKKVANEIIMLIKHLNPEKTIITVSTQELKEQVLLISPVANVWVIANALDEKIFFPLPKKSSPRIVDFAWRGSDTHQQDLHIHYNTLKEVTKSHTVEFIGHNPFWAREFKHVILSHPGGLLEYFKYISQRKWGAFVVMLEDNTFNRCKSNIMYLEAVYAGANVIAPAWPEWNRPGVLTYGEGGKYPDLLNAMYEYTCMTDEKCNIEYQKTAFDVKDNYKLSEQNSVRYNKLYYL